MYYKIINDKDNFKLFVYVLVITIEFETKSKHSSAFGNIKWLGNKTFEKIITHAI